MYQTIFSFCLKCRKHVKSKDPKAAKANKGTLMRLSKCAVCDNKQLLLIKEQEASELFSNLELKAPSRKIPLVGDILFKRYKMNKVVNRFSSTIDKLMPEMHWRQIYK